MLYESWCYVGMVGVGSNSVLKLLKCGHRKTKLLEVTLCSFWNET